MVRDSLETETLARLYLDQGHPERAAPIFERILSEDPGRQSAAEGLARCQAALKARPAEDGMEREKKLAFLKRMLSRLTGEATTPPAPRPEPVAIPTPSLPVQAVVQQVVEKVVEKVAKSPPPVRAPAQSPRERKLQLLQAMLQRLTEA